MKYKFKDLTVFIYIVSICLLFSCQKTEIQGVYHVYKPGKKNPVDTLYIERLDKNTYKINTPSSWSSIGAYKNNTLTGSWEYPNYYHDKTREGLKGTHIASYIKDKEGFDVKLFNLKGVPKGTLVWKKVSKLDVARKESKTIYLTFDDSPFTGTTNITKALEEEKIKATFFIVGQHINLNKEYTKAFENLIKSNNLIANHTYNHAFNDYDNYYRHPKEVLFDIENNIEQLSSVSQAKNVNCNIIRFPGRNVFKCGNQVYYKWTSKDALTVIPLINANYRIFGWDVEWQRNTNNGSIESYINVLNKINKTFTSKSFYFHNKCIVLLHDDMFLSKAHYLKLKILISALKRKGYKFETLDSF